MSPVFIVPNLVPGIRRPVSRDKREDGLGSFDTSVLHTFIAAEF